MVLALHRRETDAAIAHERGRHTMVTDRRQHWVPADLGIKVRAEVSRTVSRVFLVDPL